MSDAGGAAASPARGAARSAHDADASLERDAARTLRAADASSAQDVARPPFDVPALRAALLAWYDAHARPLPWRVRRDPYRVWVAEVMLQQTRVEVVIPAYERFLRRFPDLASLARASEERVLAAWSGLGYYTRARSLHRAARALVARGETTFPADADAARTLPGVGPYTLAAVLSIAYGLPHAAVDANVARVLARLACLGRPDARLEPHRTLAAELLDRSRPGEWNEALMELGETVCRPRAPQCGSCPVHTHCLAHARGVAERHPPPRERRAPERVRVALTLLHDGAGRVLLERGAFPHLPHLWLPLAQVGPDARGEGASVGVVRHAILHRQLEVEVYVRRTTPARLARAARNAKPERRVFARAALARVGRSSLLTKALALAGLIPRAR
ncbi:MAG TPA: A/G-specific adenine glycosylase [Candidatus Binatia bacterium]